MIDRSRVVIVICPALEDTVRGDRRRTRNVVLIENAPGSAEEQATPEQAAAVRRTLRPRRRTRRSCSTPGTFEAYQGLDLLFASMALVARTRPDARLLLAGGKPDQVEQARAQARGGRHRRRHDLRRRAAGGRDPGVPAGVRRARVAAVARHEHAAEDLPVPALGQADRRDAAADAYAGARRRDGDSDGRVARGVRATASSSRSPTRAARQRLARTRSGWPKRSTATRPTSNDTRRACAALDPPSAPLTPGSPVKDVA